MVLHRPRHRSAPFGGCTAACCNPAARREVRETITPLPAPCRLAFLMGASNTSVPSLAEGCVAPMRRLPREVCTRIFELSQSTVCRVVSVAPPPPALYSTREQADDLPALCQLSLR